MVPELLVLTVHLSLTQRSSTARCDLTTAYVSPCRFSSFQLLTTLTTFWTENLELTRHCYTPALRLSINPCGKALKGGENTWPFLRPPTLPTDGPALTRWGWEGIWGASPREPKPRTSGHYGCREQTPPFLDLVTSGTLRMRVRLLGRRRRALRMRRLLRTSPPAFKSPARSPLPQELGGPAQIFAVTLFILIVVSTYF